MKNRLDLILVEKGLAPSRQRAQSVIMAGKILVNNHLIDKPGVKVDLESQITMKEPDMPYVSRGALKLEEALKKFNIDVNDLVCLDVGASTGGFTDCLLQFGALKIYAVDVGYGQLAWKLRQNSRVVTVERMNIRYMPLNIIKELVDIVTIDTSFISLKIVVPAVLKFMKQHSIILALIKPQFEVGKDQVGKGGVVRDPILHKKVIDTLSNFFVNIGLQCQSTVPSPILGPKGNKEFIIYLKN